jgi:hypothetical protein
MTEREPDIREPAQGTSEAQPERPDLGGPISRARAAGADFVYLNAPGQMMVLWLNQTWGARADARHVAEKRAALPELPDRPPVEEEIPIIVLAKVEEEKREKRRKQNLEAQRRWRQNNLEPRDEQKQRCRQNRR